MVGDALDSWRVVDVIPGKCIELRAEMRLLGIAYWYSVLPLHAIVFSGMLRGLKRAAERAHAEGDVSPAAREPSDVRR